MTAAERLVSLAGASGQAGTLLLLIGNGATAGAALVNYSGLLSGTAAEHLLTDVQRDTADDAGSFYPIRRKKRRVDVSKVRRDLPEAERVREIIRIVAEASAQETRGVEDSDRIIELRLALDDVGIQWQEEYARMFLLMFYALIDFEIRANMQKLMFQREEEEFLLMAAAVA